MDGMRQLNKRTRGKLERMLAQIDASKAVIATERDKLRELHSELETMIDSSDRGVEGLESAIDALSEHL